MIPNKKIYLGSQSPRRKELLSSMGFDFETVSIDCEEIYPSDLSVEKVASFLSELKAKTFRNLDKNEILLTADTIVVLDNEILGKPKNEAEAKKNARKTICKNTPSIYSCKCEN